MRAQQVLRARHSAPVLKTLRREVARTRERRVAAAVVRSGRQRSHTVMFCAPRRFWVILSADPRSALLQGLFVGSVSCRRHVGP